MAPVAMPPDEMQILDPFTNILVNTFAQLFFNEYLTFTAKKCPAGWQKFEYSCYYSSAGKKTWKQSRDYCQSKGADLAIIKSQSEMVGLYVTIICTTV